MIKKIKSRSLKWQLISRLFLILIVLLICMEIFQYETMRQYLYASQEQILDAHFHNMKLTKNITSSQQAAESAKTILNLTVDNNMGGAVIDSGGNIIGSSISIHKMDKDNSKNKREISDDMHQSEIAVPELSREQYKKLLQQHGTLEGYTLVKDKNNNLEIVGFRKIGNTSSPSGLIQLNIPAAQVQGILLRQVYSFIAAAGLILIAAVIIVEIVFKYTLKPLYHMTAEVEQINVGQLDKRLPVENKQLEIDSLASAFNNMLERLETSFKQEQIIKEKMRQFVSDASHELRTPLTSIHGFVEVLLRGAAKSEEQLNSSLKTILIESERLTKLVNDLLTLTRLDQHAVQEMKLDNISEIIEEVLPQLNVLSGERKIELQLTDNIFAYVNRDQIKQVILNLVQNAIRHTDEKSGVISISTAYSKESSRDFAVIKVADNGTGISNENLNKIFDRFFRSEEHRARKYGGYGLGLSIVKAIVDAHEGKIEVASEIGSGTVFSVYLKLKNVRKI